MTATAGRRSSARLLVVEGAQFMASFVVLGVALWFWAGHGSALAAVLLPIALFGYGPLRLGWIVARWVVETYNFTDDALTARSGVFRRQERHLPWSSVVAVDEQAGLLFRLFRIRRLQLAPSDAAGGSAVLRALDAASAAEVRRRVHTNRRADAMSESSHPTGVIYRTSLRELALMSVVNGRFALLAPPVLFAAWTFLEDVGVSTFAFDLFRRLPTAVLALVSVLAFILIGALATISRYQGFSARVSAERTLVLSYGLVEKRERHVDLASIEGIVLRRSLVEQLLRRSRLAVLTFKGADDVGASHVLPSLPDGIVRRIARSQFADLTGESAILPDRPPRLFRQVVRAAAILAGPAAVGSWLLGLGVSVGLTAAASLVTLGIVTTIARGLVLSLEVGTTDVMRIERHLVTETETFVRAHSCHIISSVHVRETARPLLVSVHLYAGGARHYVGTQCSAESIRRLRDVARRVSRSSAQRQRQLARTSEPRS
ncbi:MAG: PH domain-containing protein [Microbacterium sp.]|nr:PH domain-containing protein [Microbacterium sp.]